MSRVIEGTSNSVSHPKGQILSLSRLPIPREGRRTYSMNTKALDDPALYICKAPINPASQSVDIINLLTNYICSTIVASTVTFCAGFPSSFLIGNWRKKWVVFMLNSFSLSCLNQKKNEKGLSRERSPVCKRAVTSLENVLPLNPAE